MTRKVFFIGPSAYTLGGIQTWLDYIVPGVMQHGWRSTLVLTSGQHHNVERYTQVHPLENVLSLCNPTGTMQGRIEAIEALFEKHNPDLVVVLNIVDTYQAVRNLRSKGKHAPRVIASMHGIHPGLIGDFEHYSDVIDAVVSTNRLAQRLVTEKAAIAPQRSMYAPYGVRLNESKLAVMPNQDGFTLAYVGRIEEDQKRISDALEIFSIALEKIPNLKVLIAGDGEELPSLIEWMESSKHRNRISYLGLLDHKELDQRVYQKADALLLTSHWETGPIVAWEAINNGVLLISSKYIGFQEEGSLLDNENCLLFDIGAVDVAIAKIKLAMDLHLRGMLVDKAKTMLESRYTESRSIATWVDCFNMVCTLSELKDGAKEQIYFDRGRLTRWFGQRGSQRIRNLFGTSLVHSGAGGEWPHSYSGVPSESEHLLEYVRR